MPKNDFVAKIPYGTKDFLVGEASQKRALEAELSELFSHWSYQEVVTPSFEYLEIFESSNLSEQAFKFFGRKGETLLLRPDMTSPIARLASTRLREAKLPQRLFYIANVFRHEDAQAGRQCEFYQAGVEMIGAASAAADAEMVALAVETLKKAGLSEFKISMGHVGFLNGIVESTGLFPEQKDHIRKLLSGHDLAGLESYARELGLKESLRKCLREVLFLHGGREILNKAASLSANEQSNKALDNLGEIFDMLEAYKVAAVIDFDLGMIRDFDYYTGMVFEGYTHGLGFPVCGGGRYDKMMTSFGKDCPAIGFSAGVERLLLALQRGTISLVPASGIYIAWREGLFAKALERATALRAEGKQVEVALQAETREDTLVEDKEIIYIES